jgi:ketosteroid isomerase-like protein
MLKIRERIGSYSDAVMRRDVEHYLACWAEDGLRTGAGGEARGITALRAQWGEIWRVVDRMAFFTEIGAIEVAANTASTRSYCLEIVGFKDGHTHQLVGTYADDLVRREGNWVFTRRSYQVLLTC